MTPPERKVEVSVVIDTNKLVKSDYKWKQVFRNDFSKLPNHINPSELLEEYHEIISLVFSKVNEIHLEKDIEEIFQTKKALKNIYDNPSKLFIAEISKYNLAYNPTEHKLIPWFI